MSYFEQNMEWLKKNRVNIYDDMITPVKINQDSQVEEITNSTAINGEAILVLQKNSVWYRLNSSYHPTHEAAVWADQYSIDNLNTVVTMYGLGNGIFAKMMARRLKEQDFLFIYEPSHSIFLHVIKEFDLTELLMNKKVIIVVEGVNNFDFHNLYQNAIHISNMSTQIHCAHPYYDHLFRESYLNYWKEIKDTMVHTKININTEILFGQRVIINSLRNMKYIKNSNTLEDFLTEVDTDVPALVISAGPSLKENIEELKKAKGRAYLFVVDRILDYVLDNGLVPDFIVTIDPIKPVEYFTTREDVRIPLLCQMSSNWEVLDAHKGKKIFYGHDNYYKNMYEAAGKNPSSVITGASVATAAFSICIKLGFKKIVLVGQDLAYDGKFTHAGGVAEEFNMQDCMVEGINGEPVRSRFDWHEFLVWFQDIIQLYPNITVIDTKQRGAKIKGTILMPLSEVLEKYGTKVINFEQVMEQKPNTFNAEELEKIRKFLDDSLEELEYLEEKSKEAIQLCDQQLEVFKMQNKDGKKADKILNKLSRINKKLNEKSAYCLLDSYITSISANNISKMYYLSEDKKQNLIDTYEKSKIIYGAIIDGARYVIPLLKETLVQYDSE